MVAPSSLRMLPPYPQNLPRWWKEEYDDLLIYARHSCMIPAVRRSDMSLIHQAIRSLFHLRLTTTTIRGVEERYEQMRALAPWMLAVALRKNYGWTNEPAWQDLLPTTAFSVEASRPGLDAV